MSKPLSVNNLNLESISNNVSTAHIPANNVGQERLLDLETKANITKPDVSQNSEIRSEISSEINSEILTGWVRHRRFTPITHSLQYDISFVRFDLDEVEELFSDSKFYSVNKANLIQFKRTDYFQPNLPDLKCAVLDEVENTTGKRPNGRVEVITHLRYFGHNFNPVTFYFCYHSETQAIPLGKKNEHVTEMPAVILAEITNTPWDERHHYVLSVDPSFTKNSFTKNSFKGDGIVGTIKNQTIAVFDFPKVFHVSPFNPMDMDYHWSFKFSNDELLIHMDTNKREADGSVSKHMDATLKVARMPATTRNLHRSLLKFPGITLKVVWGIYWNALKLWLKRSPFYDHPDSKS